MPYIDKKAREKFDHVLSILMNTKIDSVGELNYLLTSIISIFRAKNKENYALLNSLIGVLECAKLELYRRVITPYEDRKKEENGDAY